MSVDPAALLAAAAVIEEQAEALDAADAAWDQTVRSAMPGWIGRSRDALEELTAGWAAQRTTTVARLRDYAASLRLSAASYAGMDVAGAHVLELPALRD